eukprot:848749-Ditylum_brightwellii.AAC.1
MPSLMLSSQPSSIPSMIPSLMPSSQPSSITFLMPSLMPSPHCKADCCFVLNLQIKTMEQKVMMVVVFLLVGVVMMSFGWENPPPHFSYSGALMDKGGEEG